MEQHISFIFPFSVRFKFNVKILIEIYFHVIEILLTEKKIYIFSFCTNSVQPSVAITLPFTFYFVSLATKYRIFGRDV